MVDRVRLARILGMFGSSNDAEVLAAARHAHRMITNAGTDWPTLLNPPTNGATPPQVDPWLDLQTRDAALFSWVMNNYALNSVAKQLWSGMGSGQRISDKGIRIGRMAMHLSRAR